MHEASFKYMKATNIKKNKKLNISFLVILQYATVNNTPALAEICQFTKKLQVGKNFKFRFEKRKKKKVLSTDIT